MAQSLSMPLEGTPHACSPCLLLARSMQASSSFRLGRTDAEHAFLHSRWHRRWVDQVAHLSRYRPLDASRKVSVDAGRHDGDELREFLLVLGHDDCALLCELLSLHLHQPGHLQAVRSSILAYNASAVFAQSENVKLCKPMQKA